MKAIQTVQQQICLGQSRLGLELNPIRSVHFGILLLYSLHMTGSMRDGQWLLIYLSVSLLVQKHFEKVDDVLIPIPNFSTQHRT